MFSIGQFSRITGLTTKTIRLYHEEGLLAPGWVGEKTGCRYFDIRNVEQARAIAYLRELALPLAEIKEILDHFEEEADILTFLIKHRQDIRSRSSRAMARTGLRMMPTSPSPPLKFRTAGFPRYGFKASISDRAFLNSCSVKPAPSIPSLLLSLPPSFAHFCCG